jgi:hypothetical protein
MRLVPHHYWDPHKLQQRLGLGARMYRADSTEEVAGAVQATNRDQHPQLRPSLLLTDTQAHSAGETRKQAASGT